jgi:hypothetical protein
MYIGCHVRQHKVGRRPVERGFEFLQRPVFGEVPVDEKHARDGLHGEQIQRDNPASGPDQRLQHLAPAAGCRAQIHDRHAGPDQAVFLLQFNQLECRTGAETLSLGKLDVVVVEMLRQPLFAALASRHDPVLSRAMTPC